MVSARRDVCGPANHMSGSRQRRPRASVKLLQHRVWRPRALDAWRRAGFTLGQTILDVGCGPGHAAIDLAGIVGRAGGVVAVDRSRRFLDALATATRSHGITNIDIHERDLDRDELPAGQADGAWCRWVLSFVNRPREVLARITRSIRDHGVMVLHEYFDYSTWRMAPHPRGAGDHRGARVSGPVKRSSNHRTTTMIRLASACGVERRA